MSKVDPAVFYWLDNDNCVCGILACHVDDFVWGGTAAFDAVVAKIRASFSMGKETAKAFKYCGMELETNQQEIYLHQESYIDSLTPIEIGAERVMEKDAGLTPSETSAARSKVGQLLWVAHQSRPDLLFDVTKIANNRSCGTVGDILEINKVIEKAKTTPSRLKFQNFARVMINLMLLSTQMLP